MMTDKFSKKSVVAICVVAFAVLLAWFSLGQGAIFFRLAVNDPDAYIQQLANLDEQYGDNVESRIIVKTDRKISDNNSIASASGFAGLNVLQYKNREDAEKAIIHFSSLSFVEYAQFDVEVKGEETEAASTATDGTIDIDSLEHLSWGADLLGIDSYQQAILSKYENLNQDLPTVYVAVLDTGIDTDNEFLHGRIAYDLGKSFRRTTLNSKYDFEDDNSHGTHVSGTIADLTLSNVKIIPIKVLSNTNSGTLANILSGMAEVVNLKNQGINIVAYNMSISGEGLDQSKLDYINQAFDNNVMPVVSAGNENYYVEDVSPANCEKALTISALAQNTVYQNFPHIAQYSNYGSFIDLCLPGTDVLSCVPAECNYQNIYTSSTGGKYALNSGTSMAAPHATAMVALYATYFGSDYNVEEVEREIKSHTYDFGDAGWDAQYGYGVPTVAFALEEDALTAVPELNYGSVDEEFHFYQDTLSITIENRNFYAAGRTCKIYYTLDGSYPTLLSHQEYTGAIHISESTLIRFVIYLFDEEMRVCGRSEVYEATYYKGDQTDNSDGTGFEINDIGRLTRYTSGLKHITIPEEVDGKKVTGLAMNLFRGLNIESVKAEGDLIMGSYPFYCCSSLKSIYLGSKPAPTFNVAQYCFALEEVIFPNFTEIIGAQNPSSRAEGYYGSTIFKGCFNIERVIMPKARNVRNSAFSYFKKLKEIELDWENLISIEDRAFEHCIDLEMDIAIGDTFNRLGMRAFEASGIKSVKANGVTAVGSYTFANCSNLQSAEFAQAGTIGDHAFSQNGALQTVTVPGVVNIGQAAFENCTNLTEFDFGTCQTIGDGAFYNCGLTSADLRNVTSVSPNAFSGCKNLLYILVGSNSYLIANNTSWADSFYTKVLLLDKNYSGKFGAFILGNYPYTYNFENYEYKVYVSEELLTATFLLPNGEVIRVRHYMYGDQIVPPETFTVEGHSEYHLFGWKDGNGNVWAADGIPAIRSNIVLTAEDYQVTYVTPHVSSDWITVAEANCTDDGYRHKICTICQTEVESEIIPAAGHVEETVEGRRATCTQTGSRYTVCSVCNIRLATEIIPATGHTEEVVHGRDATCTEDGLTEGKKCSECQEVLVAQTRIPATGHRWGEWELTKEPEADNAGEETRTCLTCGETETRTTDNAALMQKFKDEVDAIAGCTTMEERFAAIQKAATTWGQLSGSERQKVQDAYERLQVAIQNYNVKAEEVNTEFLSAFDIALRALLATLIVAALPLAAMLFRKRM